MKKLFKSYKFWTALAGALGLFAVAIGKMFGLNITAEGVEELIMALCGVLVVLGFVVKPKDIETDEDSIIENDPENNTCQNEDEKIDSDTNNKIE